MDGRGLYFFLHAYDITNCHLRLLLFNVSVHGKTCTFRKGYYMIKV